MQDSASFWTDIKILEEQLAKSPDSLCFARLSEVYLKVGLIDDALHVARQGIMKHPRYLSGQRAFSFACHAKGLHDEALAALQLVTEALPEDVPSQKMLGRLLVDSGKKDAACRAFRTALEFAPDDVECRIELESLARSSGVTESAFESGEDDEEVIEDLEMLEEIDILEEDQPESEYPFQEAAVESDSAVASQFDPLSTSTLAELYVRQGFIPKALEIYRAILADNPADQGVVARVAELELLEGGASEPDAGRDDNFEITESVPVFTAPADAFFPESEDEDIAEPFVLPVLECQSAGEGVVGFENSIPAPPLNGTADNALAVLDGWLENIGRIKLCR